MNQKTRQDIKKRVTKKRNREVGINIRLLPEEKKHITELAKACKLSVSEMFRQIMRGQKLRSIPADAYTDILFLFATLDEYIVPKSALVEFLVGDFAFEIVHKSTWHMNTILQFAEKK